MGYSGNYTEEENKENVGLIVFVLVVGFLLIMVMFAAVFFMSMRASVRRVEGTQTARVETRVAQQTATAEYCSSLAVREDYPNLVIHDTFISNVNEWPVGIWDDDYVKSSEEIIGGVYRIEAEAKKRGFIEWRFPEIDRLSDFYLTVDTHLDNKVIGDELGVVFRVSNGNYYTFYYQESGYYRISLFFEDEWTNLEKGYFTGLKEGMNTIKVIALGSDFCFFINDNFIAEVNNSELSSGNAGIMFGLDEEGDFGVFEFDNFEIREPQKE